MSKTLKQVINITHSVSEILSIEKLSDNQISDRWSEYESDGCSFISIDIFNNRLREFKCYLHRREQSNFTPIEWGEYSFSLLNSKNQTSNIRKIAHRIKPMPVKMAENYVIHLFESANATKYMHSFLELSKIIADITKSKRYPIIGGGFTIDKANNGIKEIKLYYSLMHFDSCYAEYCDNENFVRELSTSKLINELNDSNFCNIYSKIKNIFLQYNVPLSIFGVNKDVTADIQTNKFYYRDWKNRLVNPIALIDDLHCILFNTHIEKKYVDTIREILKQGYRQGEICVCSDGTSFILKLCYEA